ncbi:MAG: hypothetical protein ACOCWU_01100 [Spirochaetota bacterium]
MRTQEVEQFVVERTAGASRMAAGRGLPEHGVAAEYLRRIERMIITVIERAKALFADLAPQVGGVYRWLVVATAEEMRPLVTLNAMSVTSGGELAPGLNSWVSL